MKIYGRGTVDGNGLHMALTNDFGDNLLIPDNCTNFTADGITFRDAGGWGLVPTQSTNLLFSNLKIFNYLAASQDDGIDVVDSQAVTVSNVVAVTGDDSFSTKSYNYPIDNVLFENSLLWSAAIGCKIGWTVATPQNGITYSNIVVYNCMNGVGLTEYDGGSAGGSTAGNLAWDNIDIESNTLGSTEQQAWGVFLIQVTNGVATNVMVGNITVRQSGLNGAIGGIYTNTIINGITFSNISMPGLSGYASNLFQMDLFNLKYYTNLIILPGQSQVADVYLTNSDASGSTSFNAAGNWSNGHQPVSTTNYLVAAYTLRTPTGGSTAFADGSLTLYDAATLALKNDNSTTTMGTSPATGLFLNNSTVKNVDVASDTLAGYVTLLTGGGIFNMAGETGQTFTISAAIGGPGAFQAGISGNSGTIQLSGVNTYTGGTFFGTTFSNYLTLRLSGAGTLGSTNGPLTFNGTNDLLDLNGTSQGIGNLSGTAGTITNSAAATSRLTVGNGDNGGGTFSGAIVSGNGPIALVKAGAGIITLSGTNTYTGTTSVSNGTLLVNGSLGTNVVSVTGGSLGGTGLIAGPVVVTNFGTLTAGSVAIGTLTISNNLTLASTATVLMKVNPAAGTNDLICGLGKVSYNGTLVISNLSGTLTNTDSFKLFSAASYTGNFTNIAPATPGAGLLWTNRLALDGTLGVITGSLLPGTPTNLIYSVSNGSLIVGWPAAYTGWLLQTQTNGLGTNWATLASSATTNQMSLPINPANGSVFYRLAHP